MKPPPTHLLFIEQKTPGKKKVFTVQSTHRPADIGVIKWFKYHDCYAFFPRKGLKIALVADCIDEISKKLNEVSAQ